MPTSSLVNVSFHFPSKSTKTRFSFSGTGLPGMPPPSSWLCPVIISGCHSPLGTWVGAPRAHMHKGHGDLHSEGSLPQSISLLIRIHDNNVCCTFVGNQVWASGGSMVKNPPADAGDVGSIPGPGRSPGGGHGNPLQDSCLENPMDRGAWWATVHGVAKSQTRSSD